MQRETRDSELQTLSSELESRQSSDSEESDLARFRPIAQVDQIPEEGGFAAIVEGREIAVFRYNGEYYAVENSCPHRGGPIVEGEFEDGVVCCPWHAWPFDVRTGVCKINNAAKLETFEVEVEEGQIRLKLPD